MRASQRTVARRKPHLDMRYTGPHVTVDVRGGGRGKDARWGHLPLTGGQTSRSTELGTRPRHRRGRDQARPLLVWRARGAECQVKRGRCRCWPCCLRGLAVSTACVPRSPCRGPGLAVSTACAPRSPRQERWTTSRDRRHRPRREGKRVTEADFFENFEGNSPLRCVMHAVT